MFIAKQTGIVYFTGMLGVLLFLTDWETIFAGWLEVVLQEMLYNLSYNNHTGY